MDCSGGNAAKPAFNKRVMAPFGLQTERIRSSAVNLAAEVVQVRVRSLLRFALAPLGAAFSAFQHCVNECPVMIVVPAGKFMMGLA